MLARLHVDSLAKNHNRRDIQSAISSLPSTINDTYEEALKRIHSQADDDVVLARKFLSWISHALRPVAVEELQQALAVMPGDEDLDDEALTGRR